MIHSNGRKRGGSAKGKMKSRTSRYGRKEILGTKHTEDNGREESGVSGEYSGVAGALGTCGRAEL